MTRKVVIGMIRAALLASALFLAFLAIPFVGRIVTAFAPAPILIYAVGRPAPTLRATASVFIAAIVASIAAAAFGVPGPFVGMGGWFWGVCYLLTVGLGTIVMAWMLEHRRPFELIVAFAAGAPLLAFIGLALLGTGSPGGMSRWAVDWITAQMAIPDLFYKYLVSPAGIPLQFRNEIVESAFTLFPALAALAASLAVLLNLRFFWRWAGKQRLPYPLFADLTRWSAPEHLVWALIATGAGYLIPFEPVSNVALNCFLIVGAIYWCQGLAIMEFYFQVLAVPSPLRALIYVVTGWHPVVIAIVCLAGIFDMWIDFRRLKPPSQEAGSFGDFL